MAWVTWRQHRLQFLIGIGMLVSVAVAALATGLPMHAAYHRDALSACLPPTARSGCDIIVHHFQTEFGNVLRAVRYLVFFPALVGLFVGAPLVAREFEQGTYRLAWTQTVTRRRWLLSKTVLLAVATALGAFTLSALAMWWRHPFDVLEGRMSPSSFEVEGIVVPAYAVFALCLGVFAGLVLRRSVPAMCAALVGFFGVRLAVAKLLRPHYLPARHDMATGLTPDSHSHDWVLNNSIVDAVGHQITSGREDLAILHARHARIDASEYLLSLGWHRAVTFQPGSRFWVFQGVESAVFILLAAAIVLATVRLLQRTPS